jgi:uncharacterized membrane protein
MSTMPSERRYAVAIFLLMIAASGVSVLLVLVRMSHTESIQYGFLMWNLLLAWLPLLIAALASAFGKERGPAAYVVLCIALVPWLLLFPNAPYILTDFQHLSELRDAVPTWYDVILLIWFAWTGLLLGIVALHLMQSVVTRMLGARVGWCFAVIAIGLAGLGIFIGRFLHWNSWDVPRRPRGMAHEIWVLVAHPLHNAYMVGFAALFALFFLVAYLTVHLFGRLMRERGRDQPGAG